MKKDKLQVSSEQMDILFPQRRYPGRIVDRHRREKKTEVLESGDR